MLILALAAGIKSRPMAHSGRRRFLLRDASATNTSSQAYFASGSLSFGYRACRRSCRKCLLAKGCARAASRRRWSLSTRLTGFAPTSTRAGFCCPDAADGDEITECRRSSDMPLRRRWSDMPLRRRWSDMPLCRQWTAQIDFCAIVCPALGPLPIFRAFSTCCDRERQSSCALGHPLAGSAILRVQTPAVCGERPGTAGRCC
ncbi:uncharacterized protein BJ171DRAFT_58302 [Polychytrium aggregatum]|uniref:uncharacterized protein n=1 Tax=Polychytrium aggregatum TaxID=110093 RepID=UPI0022FED2A0|nr:uncharacterized protein BJ171DRAFT_58302 [Polychytrium aggregatum]KAI9190738.1 hypothetical protein BJ171DRAFT_58302 [Polychytrium aggregatum]